MHLLQCNCHLAIPVFCKSSSCMSRNSSAAEIIWLSLTLLPWRLSFISEEQMEARGSQICWIGWKEKQFRTMFGFYNHYSLGCVEWCILLGKQNSLIQLTTALKLDGFSQVQQLISIGITVMVLPVEKQSWSSVSQKQWQYLWNKKRTVAKINKCTIQFRQVTYFQFILGLFVYWHFYPPPSLSL